MSKRTQLPTGQWCIVKLDGDGVRLELPNDDALHFVEFEFERGMCRQRVDRGAWTEWLRVEARK